MVDLDQAGHRLASHPAGPLTPIPALRQRIRRRHRRRRFAAALGAAGLTAVAGVGAVTLPTGHHTDQVQVGSGAYAYPAHLLPVVAHPRRWMPFDIGLLRLWAPSEEEYGWAPGSYTFTDIGNSCMRTACLPPHAPVPLTVERATPTTGLTPTRLNGLKVWERHAGSTTVYDVPSLDVRLVATTRLADRVAATMGPSSLQAVLTTTYPVARPARWKTLRFDAVAVSVPASWPVKRGPLPNNCAFSTPTAYIGELRPTCVAQTNHGRPLTLLGVGGSNGVPTQDLTRTATIETGHATIKIAYGSTASSYLLSLTVHTTSGTAQATIGLGSDPALAEEILSSLRPAS